MVRRRGGSVLLCALLALGNGCGDDTRTGAREISAATPTAGPPQSTRPPTATPSGVSLPSLRFSRPLAGQLSLVDSIAVDLPLPATVAMDGLKITLDGEDITSRLTNTGGSVSGELRGLAPGTHRLSAWGIVAGQTLRSTTPFETVALENPAECEVLNNAACLLPYPSSRFLEPAATWTGFRVSFPVGGMPRQNSEPLDPRPYAVLDGFSPAVQILMHFPAGIDLIASNVPRLSEETRTVGLRSLEPDSPSLLIDADSGERVLHFAELDSWAEGLPERQVLYLRPATALKPGHRYIVAVRNLFSPEGAPVEAEPAFAALRDGRPTTIDAVESRRASFDSIFETLGRAGVPRFDLILAFDFVVQSDEVLAEETLVMRDYAFSWLDLQMGAGIQTFAVDRVTERDCSDPETLIWRLVEGTFQVPLFLDSDPIREPFWPGRMTFWLDRTPIALELMDAPFTISIPCAVLRHGGSPTNAVLIGHDAYETGDYAVSSSGDFAALELILAATDWLGQSRNDQVFALHHLMNANVVPAFADRLRQGQINALLLAHMLKQAAFNEDPTFRTPTGVGVFAGPGDELYFAGRGIGADNGLVLAALSPDIDKAYIDLPTFSQSIGLRRSVQYPAIEQLFQLTGLFDPMETALLLALRHELEGRAWPGPYLAYADPTHLLRKPDRTAILMTVAWLDQTSSNLGAEIIARTLGLPHLEGSCRHGLPGIADEPGPLSSAMVFYDTGAYDPDDPGHAPFLPPLANLPAAFDDPYCDPHQTRSTIPASFDQMRAFLRPGGYIESFCIGPCDAGEPAETPFGDDAPCEPPAYLP